DGLAAGEVPLHLVGDGGDDEVDARDDAVRLGGDVGELPGDLGEPLLDGGAGAVGVVETRLELGDEEEPVTAGRDERGDDGVGRPTRGEERVDDPGDALDPLDGLAAGEECRGAPEGELPRGEDG